MYPTLAGIHSGAHSPTALGGSAPRDQEDLLNEIKRLRERLVTLETENATLSIKLSQSTWQVENRLAEIEMHISTKNQHQYSPQQPREYLGSFDPHENVRREFRVEKTFSSRVCCSLMEERGMSVCRL